MYVYTIKKILEQMDKVKGVGVKGCPKVLAIFSKLLRWVQILAHN